MYLYEYGSNFCPYLYYIEYIDQIIKMYVFELWCHLKKNCIRVEFKLIFIFFSRIR